MKKRQSRNSRLKIHLTPTFECANNEMDMTEGKGIECENKAIELIMSKEEREKFGKMKTQRPAGEYKVCNM